MDSISALRLQIEWGADEALDEQPRDHFQPSPVTRSVAVPVGAAPTARPAILAAAPSMARGHSAAAPAETLEALYAALAAFDGCPLRATATTTVRPDGNPAARLIVIAEAPGADDDRTGFAFAGAAGQMLDRVLLSAGFDRAGLMLTHLVPWRPPGGRAPTEAEIQACLPFLLRLLQLVQPERLVLLGSAAARTLTGSNDTIRRLRGRWLQATLAGFDAPLPALAMLPWDQWLRSPAAKRDTWADLLALRLSLHPIA